MNIDWQSVITVVGGGSVFISAAAWLIKKVISEQLARDTETFKARLKAQADSEIEKLKNALQIAATEHQVVFSKLHEKRAEVIEQMHGKLTDLQSMAGVFVMTSENNPSSEEHRQEYDNLRKQLNEYFFFLQQHRIYLPESVCNLLEKHLIEIRKAVHLAGSFGGKQHVTHRMADKSYEAFMKAYKAFNEDIPGAQKMLETEFRKMLGVN